MKAYFKKVIGYLSTLGYDCDTIAKILGVSIDTVLEFIPIKKKGGNK